MVWLHIKRGGGGNAEDSTEFLFETTCETEIGGLCDDLTKLYNRVVTLQFVCENVRQLAQYGPMLPEEKRGLEEDDEKAECVDPNRIRCGCPPSSEFAAILMKAATDAEAVISKDKLAVKVGLTSEALGEAEDVVRGSVMMAYPMKLPEWDVIQQWIEKTLDFSGGYMEKKILKIGESCLWFAGKKWNSDQLVSKYVGRNEKTKVIVRLQRTSSGAPVREPGVDAETQKKMMAFYHKKQEEQKRLAEDSSDSYLNSMWANPNQLKGHFHGFGNINWRP